MRLYAKKSSLEDALLPAGYRYSLSKSALRTRGRSKRPGYSRLYIIENRGYAGIVPLTADGHFLINNQYKHGIGCEVLEFPAGAIDAHEEDPLITARRELMEETGYSFDDDQVEPLALMHVNPTGARTRAWWYLARNVRKTGTPKDDPVEVIENLLVTPRELLDLIHSGSFAGQGQIAAAYMAFERLGYMTVTF